MKYFYTVHREFELVDDLNGYLTGWKTIKVYKIENNHLLYVTTVGVEIDEPSLEAVKEAIQELELDTYSDEFLEI